MFYDLLLPPIKMKFGGTTPDDLKKPGLVAMSEVD